MTKKKVLSASNANKASKILAQQYDATVFSSTTKEEFTLKVDKYIQKTKIMELVSEVMAQVHYAREKGILLSEIMLPFSITMILKHFTSMGKDIPTDLESQIQIMRNLIDLDLLQPVLTLFEEKDMQEIFDTIAQTAEGFDKQIQEINDKLSEITNAYQEGRIEDIISVDEYDTVTVIGSEDEDQQLLGVD